MKLIDKDALVAEIEKIEADAVCQYKSDKSRYAEGVLDVIHRIKHLLDTLEVKEVDFEKIWKEYFRYRGDMATVNIKHLAKHFFELGLKVQKGE